MANYGANTVWLNDGSGRFTDSAQTMGTANSRDVALADLDGDGDQDAFVANRGANAVWINQGGFQGGIEGNFTAGSSLGTANSRDVALADLDDDGDTDAFVANSSANTVWLNQGGGNFGAAPAQTLGSADSYGVALADLDGDTDLDAFVANYNEPNAVWLNQGGYQSGTEGDFVPSVTQTLGNANSQGVALADLDGDGDQDAFVANQDANAVWLNQGGAQSGTEGDFGPSPAQTLGSEWSQGIALADLDGDTDLDAFVANRYAANAVWINQGKDQNGTKGTFADAGQVLGGGNSENIALADLDGDGDQDAFVATGGANAVWLNQGGAQSGTDGAFALSGQTLGSAGSFGLALADLDGDGDTDALVGNNGPNSVWINRGGGTFADSGQALGSTHTEAVALADLDGDGDLDVLAAGDRTRVWLNQGGAQSGTAGTFVDSGQILGSTNSRDAALADLDGDGDTDAFVANYNEANIVWVNQGGTQGGAEGTFANTSQTLGSANSQGVALADLDGDDDTDAFVANDGANVVWVNDGSGSFTAAASLGAANSQDVALADLDGDTDLDAFVANYNEANVVWENDGNGAFTDSDSDGGNIPSQALGSADSYGVALADLDGDGDTDAFVANFYTYSKEPSTLWINQGGAQGSSEGDFSVGSSLGSPSSIHVALADLDGDGDPDAFVAKKGSPNLALLNNRPGLLRFSAADYAASEGDGSATITVRRIRGADGAIEVDYATSDGTAVAVSDYTTATGTLSWADGETADRTFTVAITDDTEDEGEETVNLSLSGPYGDGASPEPGLGALASATLVITEETGGGSSGGGGGGGGCALDHEGRGSPGLLVLLALMGSLGLLRRRVRSAR